MKKPRNSRICRRRTRVKPKLMDILLQSIDGGKGFITSHELYNKLNDGVINPYVHDPNYMLLLDVRPENVYLQNHILIAKQWKMVESDVKWLFNATGFLTEFTFIVIYDETSTRDLSESITKILSLLKSHGCSNPLVLDGGYEKFLKLYPYLCTNKQYYTEAQLGELYTYPSVIIPDKLYLGSWKHAANEVILQHLKVTHIVNLTLDYDELFTDHIKYLTVRINDSADSDAYSHFSDVVSFIESAWDSGCVLVHCKVGVSRSTTFAVAFLMSKYQCSLASVSDLVKQCRAGVWPNEMFIHQLLRWEKDLFKQQITNRDDVWR